MTHETRKLTTDELYPHLYRDYKRAKQRIGELESYIDELKYEISIFNKENEKIKSENAAQKAAQKYQS